jgi:hypothetical protein
MKTNVFLRMKNARAEGIYDSELNTIMVLKNAIFEKDIAEGFKTHSYLKLRHKLVQEKVLQDFVLTKDYLFDSPSAAAAVIGGRAASGPLEWKTKEGYNLNNLISLYNNIDMFRDFIFKNINHPKNTEYIKQTIDFTNIFPKEKLLSMSIQEYDKLKSKSSFCYLIEYKYRGISGGQFGASRNKVFYNKNGEYYCSSNVRNKYPNKKMEELFEFFKTDLFEFVNNFSIDTYTNIEYDILPSGANYLKSKIAFMYYPNTLIYIDSLSILSKISKYFYIDINKNADALELNVELLKFFKKYKLIPEKMDTKTFTDILWLFYAMYIDNTEKSIKNKDNIIENENDLEIEEQEELFISDQKINDIVSLIKKKKNVILQGTPGVGKTFSIKRIIKKYFNIQNSDQQIKTIQFHQSFSYEEFIEGLRPTTYDQSFSIEPGIFKRYIEIDVMQNPNLDYFLIIDEINRGNLSKIFGELLMLIEKDKRETEFVYLPYSKEKFTVPKNLYIIGTMNTADRSLALMDYALRRRFSFVQLEPMFGTPKFNKYLEDKNFKPSEVDKINHTMLRINEEVTNDLGKNFAIGHSYFVEESIEDFNGWYNSVIKYDIVPILKEYYFDDEEKIKMFLEELDIPYDDTY